MNLSELEGQRLAGRFKLGKLLGQGGYGAVFEAEQISMGRRCAVKVMAPHRVSSPETAKRFELEARNTSRLNHPNTVIVYDFGRDNDTNLLFLAMEFLEGVDLNRRVNELGPMTVSESVHVVNQMAGSLQDAHDQGLVHRDIKPQNVMITTRGTDPLFVKVIDFGITKALKAGKDDKTGMGLTETGMVLGTPQYMSPEQLRSYDIDGRSDQYSVAISVYRMLTGRTPFGGDTPVDIALKHITEMPLPLRTFRPGLEVPQQFERVLLKALSKERDDRFATVMDFADALAEAADFDGTVVPSAPAADESWEGKPTGMMELDPAVEDGPGTGADSLSDATRVEPFRQAREVRSDQITAEDDLPGATMVVDSYSGAIPLDSPDDAGEVPIKDEASAGPEFEDQGSEGEPVARLDTVRLGQAEVGPDAVSQPAEKGGGTAAIAKADVASSIAPSAQRRGPRKGLMALVGGAFVLLLLSIAAALFVGGDETADGDSIGENSTTPALVDEPSFAIEDESETSESAVVIDSPEPDEENTPVKVKPEPEDVEPVETASKDVEPDKKEELEEVEEPEPKKVERGTARVFIMPWGTLYVNGRKYDDKPRQSVRLAPGTYKFELRQNGKVKDSKRARVSSGRSVTVQLNAN